MPRQIYDAECQNLCYSSRGHLLRTFVDGGKVCKIQVKKFDVGCRTALSRPCAVFFHALLRKLSSDVCATCHRVERADEHAAAARSKRLGRLETYTRASACYEGSPDVAHTVVRELASLERNMILLGKLLQLQMVAQPAAHISLVKVEDVPRSGILPELASQRKPRSILFDSCPYPRQLCAQAKTRGAERIDVPSQG